MGEAVVWWCGNPVEVLSDVPFSQSEHKSKMVVIRVIATGKQEVVPRRSLKVHPPRRPADPGHPGYQEETCSRCAGAGQLDHNLKPLSMYPKRLCPICRGTGRVERVVPK